MAVMAATAAVMVGEIRWGLLDDEDKRKEWVDVAREQA